MLLFSKKFILAYLIAITFSSILTATLSKVTTIIKENGQVIHFLSDLHQIDNKYNDINQKQLDTFIETLKIVEDSSPRGLYILIESAPSNYNRQPGILTGLIRLFKELNAQKTVIENIDIRKVAGAAYSLSSNCFNIGSLDCKSPEVIASAQESYGCCLDKFSSQDMFNEFNYYINIFTNYANICNNQLLKSEFEERLRACKEKIPHIKYILEEELKFDLSKNFLESYLNCTSPKATLTTMEYLSKLILEIGTPLMDLYTIFRINTLENVPQLIVIAGRTHIENVTSMLIKTSYSLDVKSLSIAKKSSGEIPFNLLTKSFLQVLSRIK